MVDNGQRADAEQLDVATILEGLRAEVRARRLAQRPAELSPLERDLQHRLDEIELHRVVSAHWPLMGKTVPQRVVALANKLVRRYLRWYINPIVEQQNAYNDTVARALRLLAEAYGELGEQITEAQSAERKAQDDQAPSNPALLSTEAQSAERKAQDDQAPSNPALLSTALRSALRQRAAAEPPARFPDLELRALEPQLGLRQRVSAHWPLPATTLPQRVIALANKLVRRYLRWYVNPIVEQQNAANAAITAALLAIIRLDAERRAQVAHIRSQKSGAPDS